MGDFAELLSFRPAIESDVPAIVTLVESAYRGESSRAGWTTEADLLDGQRTDPEAVHEMIADDTGVLLLAFRDDELVGCCRVQHRGDHGYFGMFAVRPLLQGGGVGKALIAEAERLARREWAAEEMHMTVITARPELIAWYERRGYRRTGELQDFPYGDVRFGLPRRSDLQFETLIKRLS